jgi:hypothetical protein
MKAVRHVGRRSFLIAVAGASVAGAAACTTSRVTEDQQWDPLDNAAPRDRGRVRPGHEAPPTHCSDGDSGPQADPHNRGRRCSRR